MTSTRPTIVPINSPKPIITKPKLGILNYPQNKGRQDRGFHAEAEARPGSRIEQDCGNSGEEAQNREGDQSALRH